MDFLLDGEQLALRKEVVRFARAELSRGAAERDRGQEFDRALWQKCADFGLFRLAVPADFGGTAADPLTMVVVMDALGYGCEDNGLAFAVGNHIFSCVVPVAKFGTEEQKRRFLPGLTGGALIGAHAMTEPQAGSDTAAIRTTAVRRGDRYVLNGHKTFVTNAPAADLFVVFARTGSAGGVSDFSAFVVERTAPGLSVGPQFSKMGLKSAPMSVVNLDDCEVPAGNLLGREGSGTLVFNTAAEWERCYLSALNLGAMRRQLDGCLAYVRERRQFGRPVGQFQSVAHRLADVRVDIELAGLLLYKVGWLRKQRRPAFFESAAVKLFTSESYVRASLAALQAHGAFGYMAESGVERQVRDSLASTIYAGTSEIQREIIASWLGLETRGDFSRASAQGEETDATR